MNKTLIRSLISEILFGNAITESMEDRYFLNVVYDTIRGDAILEKLLVGEPVGIPELRKLLRKKILNFEFIKLDGEIRPARGTTMMKYIPKSDHPKGIRPSSDKVATFYDLDKKAWRSVSNRSKEVVMKYGFGEKKKPVFVVKDRDQKMPDVEEPMPKEPEVKEPEIDDIEDLEVKDGDVETKPDVEVIEMKPKYGWKPKERKDPEEDLPQPGEIEDVIVKPKIGWKPKKEIRKDEPVEIILPQPVGEPIETPIEPSLDEPGPKPPPLDIEEEEF